MGSSRSASGEAAVPVGAGNVDDKWFDIDSFLDSYVNDLSNQDPLEQINLDFSLPFPPSSKQQLAPLPPLPLALPNHVPVVPIAQQPPPMMVHKEEEDGDEPMGDLASDSEQPSAHEELPARPQRTGARARGGASRAQSAEKGEPRTAAAQRKHQALQEKNRRAQRRFRERQKQRVVELEEQVAQLTAHLSSTTAERDALAQRAMELEASAAQGGDLLAFRSAGGAGRGEDGTHLHHTAAVTVNYNAAHAVTNNAAANASEACSDAHSLSAACSQGMTLTPKADGPNVVLSPAEICAMTQPVLSQHFHALVKELARNVVEEGGTPEADRRTCALVDQALGLWQRVGQCNPTAAKQFATAKLDEKRRGQPADERTPQIVRVLGLSDRQKAEMCSLRRLFLQRMTTVAAGRTNAAGHSLGAALPFGGTSGRSLASHQLAVRQAARHLASSLQEEHSTAVEFETAVTRHVLAPGQVAQLLIQSYPWPPDCLALSTWVAAESGEAEALGALAAEAQAKATAAAAAAAASAALPKKSAGGSAIHVSPFLMGSVPLTLGSAPASSANTALGPTMVLR